MQGIQKDVPCVHWNNSINTYSIGKTDILEEFAKRRLIFTNFYTNFCIICLFYLYKTIQCWINQEDSFLVLKLIIQKQKTNAFKFILSQFFIYAHELPLIGRKGMMHVPNFWRVAGSEDIGCDTLPTILLIYKAKLEIFVTLPSKNQIEDNLLL